MKSNCPHREVKAGICVTCGEDRRWLSPRDILDYLRLVFFK